MSLPHQTNLGCFMSSRSGAVKFKHGPGNPVKKSGSDILLCDGREERIKKMFKKVDLSVSSYDTAWMAMVPSSVNPQITPQFPSCLNWVLNNQLSDGSWGVSADRDATLTMDAISSTLACVLALKQWGTGETQINMGLEFIAANSASVNDTKQRKLVGFDIIFPGMIERAKSLNLNVPFSKSDLDMLFNRRTHELARSSMNSSEGRKAYLSYTSEGMGISQNWEMAMKCQRKNGSLFDSPSATVEAFSHIHNADCLRYLNLLVDKYGDAVPAVVCPLAIYTKLWMVDNLERLGIHHQFQEDIGTFLEETYRSWNCKGKMRYPRTQQPVQWHSESYVCMDMMSLQRENEVEGKLNSVILVQMIHSRAEEEEAIKALNDVTSSKTREFLRRCILEEEDKLQGSNNNSVIPRECRYLFWKMNVVVNSMYLKEDDYTSDKFMDTVKNMLEQPICIL